jgi:hypothetical protein
MIESHLGHILLLLRLAIVNVTVLLVALGSIISEIIFVGRACYLYSHGDYL